MGRVASALVRCLIALVLVCVFKAVPAAPGLTDVPLTLVDQGINHYATFQSHNQKIARNDNGIFMATLRSLEPSQWRLWRSTDGGASFQAVYTGANPRTASTPAIETDENNNIYLFHTNSSSPGTAYFYRFLAAENYGTAHRTTLGTGAGQKFAMEYDQARQRFYIIVYSWYGGNVDYLWVVDKNGSPIGNRRQMTLTGAPHGPGGSYPQLCLRDGILHWAWTNESVVYNGNPYYGYVDIHYAQSTDGAATWRKMNGASLNVPFTPDDTGPADRISLADEADRNTWCANMMIRGSKGHFMYRAHGLDRQHYVRYDLPSAARDIDIYPAWKVEQLEIHDLDGFFC